MYLSSSSGLEGAIEKSGSQSHTHTTLLSHTKAYRLLAKSFIQANSNSLKQRDYKILFYQLELNNCLFKEIKKTLILKSKIIASRLDSRIREH